MRSILLVALLSQSVSFESQDKTYNVLFIGNSYTYYHSIPQLFKAIAIENNPALEIEVKFIGGGGATLKRHLELGLAMDAIKSKKWDCIVLQEQSLLGTGYLKDGKEHVGHPDQFFKSVVLFQKEIKKLNVTTVLYHTWSRKNAPEQQVYLDYAYMHIAKKTKIKIAPVGLIWQKLRKNATFDLYEQDGSHPSVVGAYLAAATLYSSIFNVKLHAQTGKLSGHKLLPTGNFNKEETVLLDIKKRDVETIISAINIQRRELIESGGYFAAKKAIAEKKTNLFEELFSIGGQLTILGFILCLFGAAKIIRTQ
jgi:hypothetical protein